MTHDQIAHLKRIQERFSQIMARKYSKGAAEHGGNLWDNPGLLLEAISEVADLATYLLTLAEKIGGVEQGDTEENTAVQTLQSRTTPGMHAPKKPGDVGYDLEVSRNTILWPFWFNGRATIVPSAVKMKIPPGYYAQIVGRSSASNKRGILVHTATIDNGYTGQLFACSWNMSLFPKIIRRGERLAQVIFLPAHTPPLQVVFALPQTDRGEDGFGSTGGLR